MQKLPNLGHYREKKEVTIAEIHKKEDLLDDSKKPVPHSPYEEPKKSIPAVKVYRPFINTSSTC